MTDAMLNTASEATPSATPETTAVNEANQGATVPEVANTDVSSDAVAAEKPTILFVDDEQSILVALKRLCRKMPWTVFTANSGKEALEIAKENKITVVVSDMRMPEMDGAEVLATINEISPKTKQILMTGYSDMESTVKAINKANIYSYITKPWDNENLKSVIGGALYELQLERERNSLADMLHEKNAELEAVNNNLEERVTKRTEQIYKAVNALKKSSARLKDTQIETVKLLSNIIEQRGAITPGRASRVAKISRHMASVMGMSEDDIEAIYFAGLLSDLGKIALSDTVLTTGYEDLTPQNQEVYKQHPIAAEAMLMSIDALKPASILLRQQCEKYSGGGYPDNRQGDDIIAGAQLIGMASYFDRLRYGFLSIKGLEQDDVIKQLKLSAGKRFSAELVQLFVEQLQEAIFDSLHADEKKLNASDVKEGMILSRDLIADNGMLLFSEGKALEKQHVVAIKEYVNRSGSLLMAYVSS